MINEIIYQIKYFSTHCPDSIAIQYLDEKISFQDLERETDYIAFELSKHISQQNEPIVIYQQRGIKFVEYMIGVLKCGCCYVPIEDDIPPQRVNYIVKNVGAKIILSDFNKCVGKVECLAIAVNQNDKVEFSVPNIVADDLVYIMYTSGTSGVPKGVKIMYRNLINLINSFKYILYDKLSENCNIGLLASFSFDSSVKQVYNALFYGHRLIIAERKTKFFGRSIHIFHANNKIDVCDVTPSILELMTQQKTTILSPAHFLLVGGEKLRWSTLRQYMDFV